MEILEFFNFVFIWFKKLYIVFCYILNGEFYVMFGS